MDPVHRRRRWPWIVAATVAVLGVALAIVLAFIDEPLRRQLEARVNAQLDGYTVTIGELDLQPLGLAVELEDVTMVQDAQPSPPVAYLPRWRTSVQWNALLSGAIVADVLFEAPELYLTKSQGAAEAEDPVPVHEHGWQDAVQAVYPLEINEIRVTGGAVTYFDDSGLPPIELRDLDVRANDIRNVRSTPGRFPSPFSARCTLQDTGRLTVDGHADFLAEPTVALRARYTLRRLGIAFAQPIARHYNVELKRGVLATSGKLQVTARRTLVDVADLDLTGARIDYLHEAATAGAEQRRAGTAARAATTAKEKPATRVTIAEARMADAEVGIVDRTAEPPYRVFITAADLELHDFSNERSERRGRARLTGRFMDSGPTTLQASFAPAARQADFALDLEIRDVDLQRLNDLLRAHGGFDVAGGAFSLYTEIDVSDGHVDGYVKPHFTDLDVYDREQDEDKGVFRQLYEGVVGGVGTLLENRPRDEVATVADLSGPVENPDASTLDVVLGLIRNAYIKAIVPGLERERG